MLKFSKYLTEIYGEPEDSNFTDNGKNYDLNGLLSATTGMPEVDFPVDKLVWVFKWDDPNKDKERIDKADLNTPILIIREQGQWVTLDGLHRLAKAKRENHHTIKSIIVPAQILARYQIKST